MKFYVHVRLLHNSVTFVFKVSSYSTTIRDIVQICEKELTLRFQNESFSEGIITRSERHPPLSDSLCVMDGLAEKEDLLLVFTSKPSVDNSRSLASVDGSVKGLNKDNVLKCGLQLQAAGQSHKAVLLYSDWLQSGNVSGDVWAELASIYLKAGRFDKALQNAEEGLKRHPDHDALNLSYMKCLIASDPKRALQAVMNYSKRLRQSGTAVQDLKHKLQMLLCRVYQKLNKRDMAIVLVEGVLREKEDHHEARLEYAKLTYDLGEEQAVQSLMILLSGLVRDKADKIVGEYLTKICQQPKGMKYLQRVSGDAWSSVAALLLLAGVFRDNGALELSSQILERALAVAPGDPNAVLGYIHLLEILNKPDDAIRRVKAFCQCNCDVPVFIQTCEIMNNILKRVPNHIYLCVVDGSSLAVPQVSAQSLAYSSEDLITLAIWFTTVKIMYVHGALGLLPELCRVLAPYHESKELHLTTIRNEAAYFACISKVIQVWPHIPKLNVNQNFIYLIGDSHCIPPAWQSIKYKDENVTLHPVLSTGTKIWHLRPESVFYPKANFLNVLSIVPDGATVIVIFGEIDCREALVQCTEKCIYDSLEDAVKCVINICINLLMELQQKHKWDIFIHPVLPVLDITRSVVQTFNSHLMVAVDDLNSSRIHYLDGLVDELLTRDGMDFKQQFAFDDTHIHPSYVQLLERSLQHC